MIPIPVLKQSYDEEARVDGFHNQRRAIILAFSFDVYSFEKKGKGREIGGVKLRRGGKLHILDSKGFVSLLCCHLFTSLLTHGMVWCEVD